MNPIQITVTGRLGDDPRTFTTRDGDGTELRLAIEIPARTSGESLTWWIKSPPTACWPPAPPPRSAKATASSSPPTARRRHRAR